MTTFQAGARVAMVSGGTRGIGLAIAMALLDGGWRVSAGARHLSPELDAHPSGRARSWQYDARNPESETAWVEATTRHFGRIDAVVHNAGILSHKSVLEATSREFDEIFEINVKSPMRLTQQVWPHLVASGEGKVVVMASLAGKRVRAAEGTLYSMSKFAVLALAHGIRHCGDAARVRCTALCPGFVATDMAAGVPEEQRARLTQPADVARVVALVLALPPSASIAEIPLSWMVEAQY